FDDGSDERTRKGATAIVELRSEAPLSGESEARRSDRSETTAMAVGIPIHSCGFRVRRVGGGSGGCGPNPNTRLSFAEREAGSDTAGGRRGLEILRWGGGVAGPGTA